ncbi:sterol-sensing domain of SREBP cleavage-activation-domain-containing protein [Lactarius quietus]|nr:sterol-sensing domain of SREBP cleavage-activation-domain-containing protein [Lactarius quietus]
MDTLGSRLLLRVRTEGHRFFHRFGLHCATHQIRVILISAVVITSLFYPALAIYSSSQPRFLAHFSSQILDPFLAADAISSYDAQQYLRDVWAAHDSLHVREDSVVRARCGVEQTLRVERVLIHSSASTDSSPLTRQLLHFRRPRCSAVPCLRWPDGQCLVVSPLIFWHHEERELATDVNILHTLRPSNNVSFAGVPIQSQMVVAWRDSNEYSSVDAGSTVFLALTYFFPEKDCFGKTGHSTWRQILEDVSKDGADLIIETQQPKIIALEVLHDTQISSTNTSVLTIFIYLAYFALAITFGHSVRKGLPVHNGIGLIFTGAIEILVSTITSLSVCALVGFRVTMIPWGIFPLIIVFIGAENMFSLVEAVVKTSITLPVKERIAEGLSRAGTSNSLKVLTYNIILGVIAFFAHGATRQFCAFAVVVLVAHWFLVHTFFVAVLSIDLQRLELEELLQQNASFTPSVQPVTPGQTAQPDGRGRKFMTTLQGLLRGRATKNISLFMLLATTGTLYFVTYPANRLNDTPSIPASIPLAQQRKQDLLSGAGDPAWHTWRMLNPREDPLVHLRIEAPTLLMFYPADTTQSTIRPQPTHRGRPSLSYSWVVRIAVRMTHIVVLPIAATVTALYALLLYLLKDAERLEAQRHRAEPDSLPLQSMDPLKTPLTFSVLPRAHLTDIELLAVRVSLENEFILWTKESVEPIKLGAADVLGAGPSNLSAAITALALDDTGSLCAAGTGAGVVAIWAISAPTIGRPQRVLRGASSAIVKWDGATPDSPVLIAPPQGRHVLWSSVLRIPDTNRLVAACAIEDGSIDIIELVPGFEPPLATDCRLQAGNPTDTVASFHASRGHLPLGGTTNCCIALLEEPHGALSALRLCPASSKPCMTYITSAAASSSSRSRCTCLHNTTPHETPPWGPPLGLHSRNSSTASTTPVLPSRSRHASMSEDNSLRRAAASDKLVVPESNSDAPLGPPETPHIPARWRSLVVAWVADTVCERGTWDVTGSRVVGLRRRSRRPPDSRDCGLSVASLERWEAWTFDPSEARINASPLAVLQPIASAFSARAQDTRETPRLPFTRVGPLVSGRTCCLAGFGNTVCLLAPADMVKECD